MKLSDLVGYLNTLDTLSVQATATETIGELKKIVKIVEDSRVQVPDALGSLNESKSRAEKFLGQFDQNLQQLRDSVQDLIVQQEPAYFADSTDLYQTGMKKDTPEYILSRQLSIEPLTWVFLQSRLQLYTDWHYPGMVIRPAHSPGVEDLVALDPMYLVDTDTELLEPMRTQFTEEYQRRLRYYVVKEYTTDPIFWNLPKQQFGFVYSFHYFNFKPLEIVKQYMTEVFGLLRPGGSFVFSYNNCDQQGAVSLVEHHFCCYTPGRLVREHAHILGYEIIYEHNNNGSTSWIELKKPGVLASIRGGQALAGIFRKEDIDAAPPIIIDATPPESVDRSTKDIYNELELMALIEIAAILPVDLKDATTKGQLNIKKVRRAISAKIEAMGLSDEKLRRLIIRFNKRTET
jgi:SAM-dependent methyltransferase